MTVRLTVGLIVLLSTLAGCTRLRFIVDAVPTDEELTETVVMGQGATAKIAMIEVRGMLADARRNAILSDGENPVDRFAEDLHKAAVDPEVKAVIVRINSPGGTVTSSDLMYRELQRFKAETGKPVIVLMAGVAASGGYYLACAGDEIMAHPTTVTGSVGVIMQTINVSAGMQRFGIHADAITSGQNKAMGSPFEPMPAEHRALFQNMVNEFFEGFAAVVRAGRPNMTESAFAEVRDGRVVTGRRAVELDLADRLGDVHDAYAVAKAAAGVDAARLVKYHRPLAHVGSVYANAPSPTPRATELNLVQIDLGTAMSGSPATFMYLWDPVVWGAAQ